MTTMTRWRARGAGAAAEGEPEEGRRHQAEGRQVSPTAAILKGLQPSYLVPPFEQSRAIGRRS